MANLDVAVCSQFLRIQIKPPNQHHRFRDLTGHRFGNLVVREYVGSPGKRSLWLCDCDCGKTSLVRSGPLTTGNSTTCGCDRSRSRITHGASKAKTPEYKIWSSMHDRCLNPKYRSYHRYGGRGISICERWRGKGKFKNFFANMGPRPSAKHSIDRIDNNGNYEPSNCRWATKTQQCRNTRQNKFLTINCCTLTIAEWAEKLKVNQSTIRFRLSSGWTAEEAVLTPVIPHGYSRATFPAL